MDSYFFCTVATIYVMTSVSSAQSITNGLYSGVKDLPICEVSGQTIITHDTICVYIPEYLRVTLDATLEATTTFEQITAKNTNRPKVNPKNNDDKNSEDENAALVPPFLIGASSVIVTYILAHCLYVHCYAKRKIEKVKAQKKPPPVILLGDGEHSASSMYTTVAKYGTPDGRLEEIETRPYIFYQPTNHLSVAETPKRNSFLNVPNLLRHGFSRTSLMSCGSSIGVASDITPYHPNQEWSGNASLCFVPINRAHSDPTGFLEPWKPVSGYLYPSQMLHSDNISIRSMNMDDLPSTASVIFMPMDTEAEPSKEENNKHMPNGSEAKPSTMLSPQTATAPEAISITLTTADGNVEHLNDHDHVNLNIY